MKTSESVENLANALAKSQAKFDNPGKNREVKFGQTTFKYSTHSEILEATRKYLNEAGIFLSQPISIDSDGNQRVSTRVQLGNEFMVTDGVLLTKGLVGSQQFGKEVTYAKRYDLMSFLGVSAADDDEDAPDLKPDLNKSGGGIKGGTNAPSSIRTFPGDWAKETSANKPAYTNAVPQNPEPVITTGVITNADLPAELFDESKKEPVSLLTEEARKVAEEMESFVGLTEERHKEIQARLVEIVESKLVARKGLALYLDSRHEGKRSFEVAAPLWEETMSLVENAISAGKLKELVKVKSE